MFIVLYDTTTNKIVHWKRDNATVSNTSVEKEIEWNANGLTNIAGMEIDAPTFDVLPDKHLFNSATKEITVDPNWVEPTPPKLATTGIPSTDTSTNQTVNT